MSCRLLVLVFLPILFPVPLLANTVTELRDRAAALETELESLPRPLAGPAGGTLGYASELTTKEIGKAMPKWVEIDLEQLHPVDGIALVPGWMIGPDRSERTHGFPTNFVVEVAAAEGKWNTVFASGPDFPDPGRHPLWIELTPTELRFVRVTATELGANFLGFSEILVFSGRRNLALGKPVRALDTLVENENWRNEFLVDGYTPLGLPITRFRQQRNGFRSTRLVTSQIPVRVELEWEEVSTITGASLVPTLLIPNLMAIGRWGQGFPAAFRIEVMEGDGTGEWAMLYEYPPDETRPFPNPGNVAWTHAVPETKASRLRLTATRHRFDSVLQATYFSLAEIEVYDEEGENIARDATVRVSHPATQEDNWSGGTWGRETLVDGFSGDGELAPMRDWLIKLDRRRQVLGELEKVEAAILVAESRQRERTRWLAIGGAVLSLIVLGLVAFQVWRSRLREANRLRERIANDLHDEIGSTLGSIALNAEVLSHNPSGDGASERLARMAELARDASQTMRDLVWVVDHRTDDSVSLLERLRATAAELLGDSSYRFETPDPFPRVGLSPEQKRHLLLFLKEAIHNVLRHAQADEVVIRFDCVKRRWSLSVEDDGRGFAFDAEDEEQLDRLRSRARKLGGELVVTTREGEGTKIEIAAPVRRR